MQPDQRAALHQWLRRQWQRRGVLAWLLRPLAALYGTLAAARRHAYARGWLRSERLPVPVIVVGNVIAGGAGKTPTTLALVHHLQQRGWQPGIISRGYGRSDAAAREVTADALAQQVGDEPLLMQRKSGVPVAVARQRSAAAQLLLATHPQLDVLVCDDGLQHQALARDIEICVFDARGVGNGWLLPAGPLREPWPRPVDMVLSTGRSAPMHQPALTSAPAYNAERTLAPVARDAQGRTVPLTALAQQRVVAVAAIARPEAFFSMLREAGIVPVQTYALPDHHAFAKPAVWLQTPSTLVCTEKDAVKLHPHRPDALAVALELQLPAAFFDELDARLAQAATAKRSQTDHGAA